MKEHEEIEQLKEQLKTANETLDKIAEFNTQKITKTSFLSKTKETILNLLGIGIEVDESFRPFKDWEFNTHFMKHNDYCIWTSNGYTSFNDYHSLYNIKHTPLLKGISTKEKRKYWNAFLLESRLRREEALEG